MYESLLHQATAKAGELTLELDLINIREERPYLHGKSIEQIIHSITRDDDEDIPIFKHITTRWDNKAEKMTYEVAIANALLDEAREKMNGLRAYLLEKYGNSVREHFSDFQRANGIPRKRNYTDTKTCNNMIKEYIKRTNTNDKLSKVLIEGMEKVKDRQEKDDRGAMLINTKDNGRENDKAKNKIVTEARSVENKENKENKEKEVVVLDHSDGSISTKDSGNTDNSSEIFRKAWDEISLAAEYKQCIEATDNEKRITFNTLDAADIELEELDRWKNRNWQLIPGIIERSGGREYKALKKIVHKIEVEKERERLKENKFSILGEESDEEEDTESKGTDHPNNVESLPQGNKDGKGQGV